LFQQSVMASLYSSAGSVLERHHFAQAMCIIQTEYCNVFESLSSAVSTLVIWDKTFFLDGQLILD